MATLKMGSGQLGGPKGVKIHVPQKRTQQSASQRVQRGTKRPLGKR
jgi:hypothetical protein